MFQAEGIASPSPGDDNECGVLRHREKARVVVDGE